MKISLKWLKDYIDIPENLELSKLVYDLTMSTVEVEGAVELAKQFDKMIVGVIKEIVPHPDADKLKVCKTDIGDGDIREIVCGGINLDVGMKVAVGLPGSMVRWHGEGDLIELGIAKVRGVESYGMICTSAEIGLSDLITQSEDAEIIDLSEFDAKAGTLLAEALGLDDTILEIDNKSLTNRPDLWGHYGIAREISAIYNLKLKEIESYKSTCENEFKVNIKEPTLCPRYIGVKIKGVSVKPSSFEIQSRIWSVGVRPINALVDITNYVMLATGNPTHAFDSDCIKGNITVRSAKEKEKLLLLDGKELSLVPDDLVIADDEGAVALAGVMGGAKDSILPETSNVILEVANFEPTGTRRTAMRHELRTESSMRYEKGIDPERCEVALSVAMKKFNEFYPDMSVIEFKDDFPKPLETNEIEVSIDWLEKRLGKKIPDKEIVNMLESLGFKVSISGDLMKVLVPTWRSTGDVSIPEDILEEVARIHGFDNFEAMPISTTFEGDINQIEVDIDRKIREYLAFRCGMQEIYTYPWINDQYLNATFPNTDGMLAISDPASPDEKFLRSSLIPNLCKAVADNLRYVDEFALFESTQVFFDREYEAKYDPTELLPLQRKNVAGAIVGEAKNLDELFRKTKGIVEVMPRYVHMEGISFEKNEKPYWADEVVWLNIIHNNEKIGNLALLSKKAAIACGIKNRAVMIFEMDIDSLKPFSSRTNKFKELPEYPMTNYDLSLLLDSSVRWEEITKDILDSSNEGLLRDLSYIGEYKGAQVPDGKKSITLRLVIGSLEKTLTSDEIEMCVGTIMKRLKDNLGAELRN